MALLATAAVSGCGKEKKYVPAQTPDEAEGGPPKVENAAQPVAIDAPATEPTTRLTKVTRVPSSIYLLRVWSESQAQVLAQLDTNKDQVRTLSLLDAADLDETFLPGQTRARQISLVSSDEALGASLTGYSRSQCGDLLVQVADATGEGYMVTGTHNLQPRPVESTALSKPRVTRLAALLGTKTPFKDWNSADAFNVDLDGDGQTEVVVAATGPVADDESFPFSVIAVFRDSDAPLVIGYVATRDQEDDALLSSLLGFADLNGDGTMEALAMHERHAAHYHHLVAYEWNGKGLDAMTDFTWGERDCYPEDEWPTDSQIPATK